MLASEYGLGKPVMARNEDGKACLEDGPGLPKSAGPLLLAKITSG